MGIEWEALSYSIYNIILFSICRLLPPVRKMEYNELSFMVLYHYGFGEYDFSYA